MLDELLAANEEEMSVDSDDEEEICVIAATSIFMRRDLNRYYGFFEVTVPTHSIDELEIWKFCTEKLQQEEKFPAGKPLWKTTYTCPQPSVSICLIYFKC